MRPDEDQVTSFLFRDLRKLLRGAIRTSGDAGISKPRCDGCFAYSGKMRFAGLARQYMVLLFGRIRRRHRFHDYRVFIGRCYERTTTSALHCLAKAMPANAASSDSSEPSVGIRTLENTMSLQIARIEAAMPAGEYLADIQVVMKDGKGKTVLDTVSDGPCLLVSALPGKYSVAASGLEQRPVMKSVDVSGKRTASLHFYWTELSDGVSGRTAEKEHASRNARHGCF